MVVDHELTMLSLVDSGMGWPVYVDVTYRSSLASQSSRTFARMSGNANVYADVTTPV